MITRRSFISFCALIALGGAIPIGFAAGQQVRSQKLALFAFDTVISVEAYGSSSVLDGVQERLEFFDRTLSRTRQDSDIYAINHANGMPVNVQPETADVIQKALVYSELSDGLFDPTIGGVVDLWDFKQGLVPEPEALLEAVQHVNWRMVDVVGQSVTLTNPFLKLDLGGIAKGYIADDIAQLLRHNGSSSALINLGGNTFAVGAKPDGSPWEVGLQDPNSSRGQQFARLPVCDQSVVASGINERSFVKEGIFYHHLLSPHTGMPVNNGCASITILSDLSVDGDALSTIAFLLGSQAGLPFLSQQDNIRAVYVHTDGTRVSSTGWEIEFS